MSQDNLNTLAKKVGLPLDVVTSAIEESSAATAGSRKQLAAVRHVVKRVESTLLGLVALTLALGTLTLIHQGDNSDRIAEIRSSRQGATKVSCREGNEKYVHTLAVFGAITAKETTGEKRQRQARGLTFSEEAEQLALFADAINPYRDCVKRVANLNSSHPQSEPLVTVVLPQAKREAEAVLLAARKAH